MRSAAKKYKVIRRLNADFEVIVQGRNEEEALYSAASIDLESWNEVDSSWEIVSDNQTYYPNMEENLGKLIDSRALK